MRYNFFNIIFSPQVDRKHHPLAQSRISPQPPLFLLHVFSLLDFIPSNPNSPRLFCGDILLYPFDITPFWRTSDSPTSYLPWRFCGLFLSLATSSPRSIHLDSQPWSIRAPFSPISSSWRDFATLSHLSLTLLQALSSGSSAGAIPDLPNWAYSQLFQLWQPDVCR